MFDIGKNNSGCGCKNELVAYLYDDLEASERLKFEKHLALCSICADEIRAFGAVRLSVADWKKAEFDELPVPAFELEYAEPLSKNSPEIETGSRASTWVEKIYASFFLKTAGGFVALLIVFGAGWFLLNSPENASDEFAGQTVETDEKSNEQVFADQKAAAETSASKSAQPQSAAPEEIVSIASKKTEADEKTSKNPESIVSMTNTEKAQKIEKTEKVRTKKKPTLRRNSPPVAANKNAPETASVEQEKIQPQRTKTKEKAPSLTEFAVEDQTDDEIRLSDIFDEVGSDR